MFKNMLFICFILIINGCYDQNEQEKWTAFIYPNKEDTKKNIKSPITFNSLEECKNVSILEIRNQNLENIAFFKCGLNCTYHEGMKLEVCEKMLSSTDK